MHNYLEDDRTTYEQQKADEKIQHFNYQEQQDNRVDFLQVVETFNQLPIH
jgi:hypothetical protein